MFHICENHFLRKAYKHVMSYCCVPFIVGFEQWCPSFDSAQNLGGWCNHATKTHKFYCLWFMTVGRFGKSIHISMISNSVTHLRSYTNSAIADIAGNSARSQTTPRDNVSASSTDIVALNDLRAIADVAAPNADVSASSADIVASNDDCFMMFHNVLSVSWCFTSGSRCFTCVLLYFTMVYDA